MSTENPTVIDLIDWAKTEIDHAADAVDDVIRNGKGDPIEGSILRTAIDYLMSALDDLDEAEDTIGGNRRD